jgi:hypothetical protein
MLAMLTTDARDGQRRPGLAETADVVKSALWMRLRYPSRDPAGADALAQFCVLSPLFMIMAALADTAVPFPLPRSADVQYGSPSLLAPRVLVSYLVLVIIAVLTLAGLRWVALVVAALAFLSWFVAPDWYLVSLPGFSVGFYALEAAALAASPGARRGRHLITASHCAVLALLAAAFQAAILLRWLMMAPPLAPRRGEVGIYAGITASLLLAALFLAAVRKMNPFLSLPGLALLYPAPLWLVLTAADWGPSLTLMVYAVYLGPPGLLACASLFFAVVPRIRRYALR